MKNTKCRSRLGCIKILGDDGNVQNVYEIDEKGKVKLTPAKSIQPKFLTLPKISFPPSLASQTQKYISSNTTNKGEMPVEFTDISVSEVHWLNHEDDAVLNELTSFKSDIAFDFAMDEALGVEIELMPDPFFL